LSKYSDTPKGLYARWHIVNATVVAGLVLFALYHLGIRPLDLYRLGFHFMEAFTAPRTVDFQFWYQIPPLIFEKLEYPSLTPERWHARLSFWHINFSYLPSAVALMLPLSALPRLAAFGVWLLLQLACFFAVLLISMRLAGVAGWQSRWLIAAAAVALAENPIGWDLRTHNVNLIYLALVLAGVASRHSWIGGIMLALSFNLKLYSASLLAGLAWWRDYRRLTAMILFSIAIALVPILLVGPSGFLELMKAWLAQVLFTATEAGDVLAPTSLRRSVAAALGLESTAAEVYWIWRALQALWLASVVAYFTAVARRSAGPEQQDRFRLADACVLLLAPLPLSTWFVPYHAIIMLPAFVLLLTVALDASWPIRVRAAAIAAPAGYELLHIFVRSWELRAGLFYCTFVLIIAALAVVRQSWAVTLPPAQSSTNLPPR
jgi:Glycosyltransferase family 87